MFLGLLLVSLVPYVVWFYWNRRKYPPGPLPLPFVGNLVQLRDKEIALWCDELTKLYGPVFTIFLPSPHVVLATFDAIKEATVIKGEHFSKKNIDPPFEYISYAPNTGIFGNNGESWRQQRRMFLSVLSDFGMEKAAIETSTMLAVRSLTDHFDAVGDKSSVEMPSLLLWCLANATNHLLFGHMFKNLDEFSRFDALIMDVIGEFDTWETRLMRQLPWLKTWPIISSGYKRANAKKARYYRFIEEQVSKQVRRGTTDSDPGTLVQAYLREMHKAGVQSYEILVAVASDVWVSGLLTTIFRLRWAMLYLIKWPEVQEKIRAEVDTVIGTERLPTFTDRLQMPYTSAFIYEALRCSNVTTFETHITTSEQTVAGHRIPGGTIVVLQYCSVLAKDPTFEDPDKFKPERFLNAAGTGIDKEKTARVVAFGLGKRQCSGESIARVQLFLIISSLLQRYTLSSSGPVDASYCLVGGISRNPKPHLFNVVRR